MLEGDSGYRVASVTVDGVLQSLTDDEKNLGYTVALNNIQGDHDIVAYFESSEDLYALPVSGDGFWTITGPHSYVSGNGAYGSNSLKLKPWLLQENIPPVLTHTSTYAAGPLSFCYSLLSHDGTLEVSIDGEVVFTSHGHQEWQRCSIEVPEGYHTLKWEYKHRGPSPEANEGAWIDEIQLPVPGPPVAYDQSIGVEKNQSQGILLKAFDAQGDYLSYTILEQPLHGTLSGDAPDLTYTPNPDYIGSDQITFRVNNSSQSSLTATVDISVLELDGGLELYWSFDGGGNSVTAVDLSGNGNDGTINGGASRVPGIFGDAISLDGSDDYVIKDIAQTRYPAYTVSFWAKAADLNYAANVGLFSNNSGGNDFQVDIEDRWYNSYQFNSGTTTERIVEFDSDTSWHHISIVCDGAETRCYWDGVQQVTVGALGRDFGEFVLGTNRGHNKFFQGLLDELRVYSRALNDQEITALSSKPAAARYMLTVNNGDGDGMRGVGVTTQIKANAPASNKVFYRWGGDYEYLEDRDAPVTTVTMPNKSITVTASYKNLYTLTVNDGVGSGSYTSGTAVSVQAVAPGAGYAFTGWTGDVGLLADPSSESTTLTMPARAASVTASFQNLNTDAVLLNDFGPNIDLGPGFVQMDNLNLSAEVNPNNTDGSSGLISFTRSAGNPVVGICSTAAIDLSDEDGFKVVWKVKNTVDAISPVYNGLFFGVQGVRGMMNDSTSLWNNVPSFGVSLYASGGDFSNAFDVVYCNGSSKGTVYQAAAPTKVSIADGFTIELTVNSDATWTVSTTGLSSEVNANGTLEGTGLSYYSLAKNIYSSSALQTISGSSQWIQFESVSIVPINSQTNEEHVLTVVSGSGSGTYAEGTLVSLTADAAAEGYQFAGWSSSAGAFVDTQAFTTSYTMPAVDAIVTANYVPVTASAHYEDWITEQSLEGESGDLLADPDGDGVNNLLEYAFNLDPMNADAGTSATTSQLAEVEGEDKLEASFFIRSDAAERGILYEAQQSSGLGVEGSTWQACSDVSVEAFDASLDRIRVRINRDVSRRFIRLQVSLSE